MKAIVSTDSTHAMFRRVRALARRADAGERLPAADYHLSFDSAARLFGEITPARLRVLDALRSTGPTSIAALARRLSRNYSNVHQDVARLIEHGLVAKNKAGRIFVPWKDIEIRVSFRAAA